MNATKRKRQRVTAETEANSNSQEIAAQSKQMTPQSSGKPSLRENVADLIGDNPVYVNSIASGLLGLDQGAVLREMMQARHLMIQFYKSERGGWHTSEEAVKLVDRIDCGEDLEKHLQRVLSDSVDNLSWCELERIYNKLPGFVGTVWQLIKDEARKELESGHRAAAVFESAEWQHSPWKRAQFLAIRESFVEGWKPKDGIEMAMIDSMAISQCKYLHWSEIANQRETIETDRRKLDEERRTAEYTRGYWMPPRLGEAEAIEHAIRMADSYNRLFLRTLRQLRDLRRYSVPVTINNPQQVNIAADGGQQVNAVKVEDGGEVKKVSPSEAA